MEKSTDETPKEVATETSAGTIPAAAPVAPSGQPGQYPPLGTQPAPFAAPHPGMPLQQPDNDFWVKFLIFMNPLASILFYLMKRDKDPVLAKRGLDTGWFAVKFWTIALVAIVGLYFVFALFSGLIIMMAAATTF